MIIVHGRDVQSSDTGPVPPTPSYLAAPPPPTEPESNSPRRANKSFIRNAAMINTNVPRIVAGTDLTEGYPNQPRTLDSDKPYGEYGGKL